MSDVKIDDSEDMVIYADTGTVGVRRHGRFVELGAIRGRAPIAEYVSLSARQIEALHEQLSLAVDMNEDER